MNVRKRIDSEMNRAGEQNSAFQRLQAQIMSARRPARFKVLVHGAV
jgi:hypothetical protein